MVNEVAIQMIMGFVRDNLQLGWSHLEDHQIDLAKHCFARALEQVNEIEELLKQDKTPISKPIQPTLIDL